MRDPRTGLEIPDMGDVPIPGSSFDVDGGGSTTMKTGGNIPPPPAMPMAPAAAAQAATPAAIPAGLMSGAPSPMPMPQGQMPSMLDVLRQAQSAGSQLYGKYSPDNRNALYAAMIERRGGMGNAIGAGLASAGDAIARGYGRSQTDFLDKTLQGEKDTTKEGLSAFDEAQKSTLAATGAGMELQKLDPNAAISKIMREAYSPLLKKLGYSDQALERMTGANVEAVAKVAADYGGKEMENLFRQASLIVNQQQARAELAQKQQAQKDDALKASAQHPVLNMLPSAMQPAPIRALNQQAGLEGGTTQQASGPYGDTVKRGDKTYVWSPVTHQYHPQ